jgi:hypothetical protein
MVVIIVGISGLVGVGYALAQKHVTTELIITSAMHGVAIGFAVTMFEIGIDQAPLRDVADERARLSGSR